MSTSKYHNYNNNNPITHPQFSIVSPSMTNPSRGEDESPDPSTYTHLFT